jgi:transcriptional regulator GlxA family with amidase domain
MSKMVNLLAINNSMMTSVSGAIDILDYANRISQHLWQTDDKPFSWRLVSIDGEPVTCSNGLALSVDQKIPEPRPAVNGSSYQPEILYIAPPVLTDFTNAHKSSRELAPIFKWLALNHHHYQQIITHCSGTWVLAEAGVLEGQAATTAWWLSKKLKQKHPTIDLDDKKKVIQSGRFLLGGAAFSFQQLMLQFVEQHCGIEVTRLLAKYLLIDRSETTQHAFQASLSNSCKSTVAERALNWLARTNISVADLASAVNVTTRTLSRHFQQEFGCSPQHKIQQLRIEKSKVLLESTTFSWQEISARCGYNDEAALRRTFKKHCGVSPSRFRAMFSAAEISL